MGQALRGSLSHLKNPRLSTPKRLKWMAWSFDLFSRVMTASFKGLCTTKRANMCKDKPGNVAPNRFPVILGELYGP